MVSAVELGASLFCASWRRDSPCSSLGPGWLQRTGRRGLPFGGRKEEDHVKGSTNLHSNRNDSYFIANMETERIWGNSWISQDGIYRFAVRLGMQYSYGFHGEPLSISTRCQLDDLKPLSAGYTSSCSCFSFPICHPLELFAPNCQECFSSGNCAFSLDCLRRWHECLPLKTARTGLFPIRLLSSFTVNAKRALQSRRWHGTALSLSLCLAPLCKHTHTRKYWQPLFMSLIFLFFSFL